MNELEFTLTDREGEDRAYVIQTMAFDDAMEVVEVLLGMGIGPLLSIFMSPQIMRADGDEEASQKALESAVAETDFGAMGRDVMSGLQSAGGLRKMAPLLLKGVYRDGKDLGKRMERDAAYAGNWKEFRQALQKVFEHNGFFELLLS